MNLIEILRQQAIDRPEAIAIAECSRKGKARRLTFRDLDQLSAQRAGKLAAAGLRPGDSVLILQPMSADLYVSLTAVLRSGLVATFIDPSAGIRALNASCRIHRPAAFIGTPRSHLLRIVSKELRKIPMVFTTGVAVPGAASLLKMPTAHTVDTPHPCDSTTPALITFTSGSTGLPKAAQRSHGFLLAQYRALQSTIHLCAGENDLTTLPIFLLANLAAGVTSVIPSIDLRSPGKASPVLLLKAIRDEAVVRTAASPALLERLADHCIEEGIRLPGLRKIYTGGAPVFPRVLKKLQSVAPNSVVTAVYGSTEAEPIAHIDGNRLVEEDLQKMYRGEGLLAGQPIAGIKLRVIKDHWGQALDAIGGEKFEELNLPNGECGEIVVTGEHVLPGYLNGRGNEETKIQVGDAVWHRTGDMGRLDAAGRLWLLGRCGTEVTSKAATFYPFSVECAASKWQTVRRSALVQNGTERVLAVEATKGCAANLEELRQALAWADIQCFKPVRRIPVDRRHNAKVDYTRLLRCIR
jgi:acyl-CoA synthetase (AMP-forming)/AMP-acid ligase II